jgi:iron complex transport system substrate-binding protein
MEPERVVVLDTGELDNAFALGVKPVGAVEVGQGVAFASYLLDRVEGIETVGTIAQPSLEAIAALNPDLILSNKVRHEAIYGQLSQIAPTVFAEGVGVTWKENLRLDAQALGKCEEAEELFASYEERLAAFKRLMGDRLAETKVSVIRSLPDQVRIYMNASFIGTVLADAGLPRPAAQNKDAFVEEATIERIPDLDGDAMFIAMFTDDNAQLETLRANPLWQQLKVVKADRVYVVPDGRWMLGIGMIAANEVLDDLYGYFL